MRKRILFSMILVVVSLVVFTGCRTTEVVDVSNPRSVDLHELYTTLEKGHPDLFNSNSRSVFRKELIQLNRSLDSMSDMDFYFAASKLTALSQDSHTTVGLTQQLVGSLHVLPLQIAYVSDAWRLIVVENSQAPMLGSEVLSINGVRMDDIIQRARDLISHDNEVWFRSRFAQLLNIVELYEYLGVTEDSDNPFTITIDHHECKNVSIYSFEPLTIEQFYQKQFATLYDTMPATGPLPVYYRSMLLKDDSVLFIQYNVCASDSEYPINSFIQDTVSLFSENRFEHVIVDLRYNSGGNSQLLVPLIDQLSVLQKQQDFSLDVLIGERTFSSAIINAMQMRKKSVARLVGSESGGSVNHYGELKSFTLPHSNLPVQYSTKYFVMDAEHQGGSLNPDLRISPTIDDLLSGVDTVLDALLM